jgi:hypothetical protein
MKRYTIFLGLALGLTHTVSQAALPPTYQRLVEFKAILDEPSVLKSLPEGSLIERIEYLGPDLYQVGTSQCTLPISIKEKPLPSGMVGARQFDIETGTAKCVSP